MLREQGPSESPMLFIIIYFIADTLFLTIKQKQLKQEKG